MEEELPTCKGLLFLLLFLRAFFGLRILLQDCFGFRV